MRTSELLKLKLRISANVTGDFGIVTGCVW